MVKINISEQTLEGLIKEAIRRGMVFCTHDDVIKAILGLHVQGNTYDDNVAGKVMEIKVRPAYKRYKYIGIFKKYRHLFPDFGSRVELMSDRGDSFKMKVYNNYGSTELRDVKGGWFDRNPHLKVGDKILITIVDPMKKYRIEIAK